MTIKQKSLSDDLNKGFNLYTISASDINPDNPNPDDPNIPEEPEDDCKFTYLKVPCKYKCIYNQLLIKLSELGVDILNDCNAVCGGKNKYIITCWNMFQAACASYELGEEKKADLLMNYIKAQLKIKCEEVYNINVSSTGNGTVTGGGYYKHGSQVTITATPDENYKFVSWNDGNTESIRTVIVTGDLNFTAKFEEIPKVNEILFGELDLTRYEINDFINTTIEEKIAGIDLNKSIKISGNSINTKEFYQSKSLHYILVPIENIELISVEYNSGIKNQLYNKDNMDDNLYKGNVEFTHNGVIYLFLYNFAISGSVDAPIILKAKNK